MIIPTELKKHGCVTRGVVHIGANDGGEIEWYFGLGISNVVCFEPLPQAGGALLAQYGKDPRVTFVPLAFSDQAGYRDITVTSSHGQQSTFLPVINERVAFGEYSPEYPLTVRVERFDAFMQQVPQRIVDAVTSANCLVIDVQGMERQVIEGMGEWLRHFDHGGIECSGVPVYDGESPESEIAALLAANGFKTLNSAGEHGDLLFKRA